MNSGTQAGRGAAVSGTQRGRRPYQHRWLAGLAALVLSVVAVSPVAAAADVDQNLTTPVASIFLLDVSEATINARADDGYRLVDLEVRSTSPYRFDAIFVRNTGSYQTAWWWYFDQTPSGVNRLASDHDARAVDIEAYNVGGNVRYAVVLLKNTGPTAAGWTWYYGTESYIAGKISDFNGRIIDLDEHPTPGWYLVVLLRNSGANQRTWWYYYSQTPAQIADHINDKGARLIDLEPADNGRFHAVFVKYTGGYWWWLVGVSAGAVLNFAQQHGARLTDLERYWNGRAYVYSAIFLNNVDSLTTRVREAADAPMQGAAWGFYLKRVGGPVIAALQEAKTFEPASMIKALHHLHALRRARAGTDSLTADVTWYLSPGNSARYPTDTGYGDDKDVCAYTAEGVLQTDVTVVDDLELILSQMMKKSDNRATDALVLRYGFGPINATADVAGMTDTQLNHRIGCTSAAPPAGFASNVLTLVDAGKLWEGVANGALLGSGSWRDKMFSLAYNSKGGFKPVVDEAAADLGRSQAFADSFYGRIEYAAKGGTYTNAAACAPGHSCLLVRRTGGGWFALPYMARGGLQYRQYVNGRFIDGVIDCGANLDCGDEDTAIGDAFKEAFRLLVIDEIKSAMNTFP